MFSVQINFIFLRYTMVFSSLNLYDVETASVKVMDLDAKADGLHLTSEANVPFSVGMPMKILDASGVSVDLAEELMKLELDIISLDSSGAADISYLQGQLDAYKAANDTSVGNLQAAVSTETAQRVAGQEADALSRETMKTDLETLIATENASLSTAINDNASNLSAEILNVEGLIQANTNKINTDVANVTQYVDSQKSRIDGILAGADVNLDSFLEVVTNYSSMNTDSVAQVAALTTRVADLETMIANLTSS